MANSREKPCFLTNFRSNSFSGIVIQDSRIHLKHLKHFLTHSLLDVEVPTCDLLTIEEIS